MGKDILVKIHKSYRWVVAICDSDLIGKRFEEDEKQLDLTTNFFKGDLVDNDEVGNIIQKYVLEDATFYIVGEKSIDVAKQKEIVFSSGVAYIDDIPFALVLL